MSPRLKVLLSGVFLLALLSTSAFAQNDDRNRPTKVDVFGGYSYYDPGGSIKFQPNVGGAPPQFFKLKAINQGFTVATTYWFNRYAGLTLESGAHFGPNANIGTTTFGPSFRIPMENIQPFGLATFGMNHAAPAGFKDKTGFAFIGGGGLDMHLTKLIDWRMIEAEYSYAHHNYSTPPTASIRDNLTGAKISTGVVFKFGSVEAAGPPPSAACTAQPTDVFAGEPVQVTASAQNFNPKHTVAYEWSATPGGKVNGTGTTVNVDTNGLQPGTYTVKAHVTDPKNKKAAADCTATFNVKQPQPPTVSCSANPSTVRPGETATITAQGNSPDNKNLTYSYKSSAGNVSGNGPSATLSTEGAQPGPITVTCSVADDRNPPLTASSDTTVTVEAPPAAPPPPPKPEASKINQIEFPNKVKPSRVDNTAKAILDDVALRLQREPDSKAVVIGEAEPSEGKRGARIAQERAVNTKAYLTQEKGIDPSRIEVRSQNEGGKIAEIWIVPAGATYNGAGTAVDENKVRPMGSKPARRAGGAKKAAAKPAAKKPAAQ